MEPLLAVISVVVVIVVFVSPVWIPILLDFLEDRLENRAERKKESSRSKKDLRVDCPVCSLELFCTREHVASWLSNVNTPEKLSPWRCRTTYGKGCGADITGLLLAHPTVREMIRAQAELTAENKLQRELLLLASNEEADKD